VSSFNFTTGQLLVENSLFSNCSACTGSNVVVKATHTSANNIGVAALKFVGDYFYPASGHCISFTASGGSELNDIWVSKSQADSETGTSQCFELVTATGGSFNNIHLDQNYWTIGSGTPSWLFVPQGETGNYLWVTNNYLNSGGNGCSTPISIGSGNGITVTGNQLVGACSGGTAGILVAGMSGAGMTNVTVSNNIGIETGGVQATYLASFDYAEGVSATANLSIGYSSGTPLNFTGNVSFHVTGSSNCSLTNCSQ
jgi:hypothetical protein